jgi:putative transposase of IS4/5 family DUF4096
MTDKTQREHNRSAFGGIATKPPLVQHVEPDCRGVIQAPKLEPRIMRYELTEYEWAAIKPFLPNKPRGVPRVNDPRVLNGIFWVLRSGRPGATCLTTLVRTPRATIASFAGDERASGPIS